MEGRGSSDFTLLRRVASSTYFMAECGEEKEEGAPDSRRRLAGGGEEF